MSIHHHHQQQQQQLQRQNRMFVYTHQLPYGVRKEICNLLDADQSWKTLGGQFMSLDATQLALIGQAVQRNGSPTDELLNKLDSANVKIIDFSLCLKRMNHCRAVEMLKPFTNSGGGINSDTEMPSFPSSTTTSGSNNKNSTLDTPTPSFIEHPIGALMAGICSELNPLDYTPNHQQPQWLLQPEQFNCIQPAADAKSLMADQQVANAVIPNNVVNPPISPFHKPTYQNQSNNHNHHQGQLAMQQQQQQELKLPDPGEEIVRMACASNSKRTSISDQEVVNQLRLIMQITYNELKQASDNFSDLNILGNGGFASVYRGNWKGTDVAIKRLKCNLMDQALNELTILNSYRIDNILPIYGISIDGPEACLVYQFMANGSLEDRLSCKKGTAPLTWNQRALIGEGVAKGLYYLHTLRDKPLVHGDVKSANVLLDSQFVPKIGDFGLARQVLKGKNPQAELCTHCTVSSIHGTSVYLPPEYLRHKILSPAVDVYSYGIVLLEMATGKRAYDGKRLLIQLVEDETRSMSLGQIGYSLKDPRLADDTHSDLKIWYELLIKLGLSCAHKIKKKRLDMGQVLSRFADFRTANSDLNLNSNTITNSFISSTNGSATARTLTPDLTTPDRQQQQQQQQQQQVGVARADAEMFGARGNNSRFVQKGNFNSILMSVEEEGFEVIPVIRDENEDRPAEMAPDGIANGMRDKEAGIASVEAMIPLLTELGVVPKQDS